MKKKSIFTCLLLCAMSITIVMADNIIRVLQVYSHGSKLTIPVANIDSLEYSRYDADSIIVEHYKTSIIRAIDSTYQIPINEVDSMVIGYLDWNEYRTQIDEIKDIITEQFGAAEEMPVEQFQTQLLLQLNNTSWVQQATINEQHDMITIQLSSGLYFLVTFRQSDYCGTEDGENGSSRLLETADEEDKLFDVSYQEGEEIISSPKILCVWGRSMPSNSGYNSHSTENEEKSGLKSIVTQSPINRGLEFLNRSLDFIMNVNDYGMLIISQTHGAPSGHFQIQDLSRINSYQSGDAIYCGGYDMKMSRQTVMKKDANLMWWVYPENCLFPNYDGIIFGNYCHSAVRANRDHKATVLGYSTVCNYYQQNDYLFPFVEKMLNGYTYQDAISSINETYSFRDSEDHQKYDVRMATNHSDSKLRFFSIFTDSIKEILDDGNPIITGKINGYGNISPLVNWVVFVHEGNDTFTPYCADVKCLSGFFVDSKGNFKCDYDGELNPGQVYGFIIGFKMDGKVYYGDVKYYTKKGESLCPDNHHPHMIDLGLPSGTKWACCNVGANKPEDAGNFYAWGDTQGRDKNDVFIWHTYQFWTDANGNGYAEKNEYADIGSDIAGTDYDAAKMLGDFWSMPTLEQCKELVEYKKTGGWKVLNGVGGRIITGLNGNSIFLPAAGKGCAQYDYKLNQYKPFLQDAGSYVYLWTSTRYENNPQYSYYFYFYGGFVNSYQSAERYFGLSIRPVCK